MMMIYVLVTAICSFSSMVTAAVPHPRRQATNATLYEEFSQITQSTTLTWSPCQSTFLCAKLDVPIDYQKPNGTRIGIPLVKRAATSEPYKGMVMMNPGGPGNPGIDSLINSPDLADIIGTNYDIVAVEPRGLGYSTPLANCSSTTTIAKRAFEPYHMLSPTMFTGPYLPEYFFQTQYSDAQTLGMKCQASIGGENQAGQHMSTAVVVRDMLSVLDAFAASNTDPDANLLNFWGFSYGTIIGQTFATMFPDRVGRVVLDGVVDAEDFTSLAGEKLLQDTDTAFSTFFIYCHLAGPELCSYHTGSTANDILQRFEKTLGRLNATEAIAKGWSNATAIYTTLQGLKQVAFGATYIPDSKVGFPLVSDVAVAVEGYVKNITLQNVRELSAIISAASAANARRRPAAVQFEETYRAISCSDGANSRTNWTLEEWQPPIDLYKQQSYLGGELQAASQLTCNGWTIPAAERFPGPWGAQTKNPILFVSQTQDPVTPQANGVRASELFPGSSHLVIDGTGHSTIGPKNKCGYEKISRFFQEGELPGGSNAFCELEAGAWNVTVEGVLGKREDWREIRTRFASLE